MNKENKIFLETLQTVGELIETEDFYVNSIYAGTKYLYKLGVYYWVYEEHTNINTYTGESDIYPTNDDTLNPYKYL